jgi:hypothetical protein
MQDATMAHYAGYTEEEIDPVFRLMVDYLHRPVCHEAFFKKYASKKFLKGTHSSHDRWMMFQLTGLSLNPCTPVGQEVPLPLCRQLPFGTVQLHQRQRISAMR